MRQDVTIREGTKETYWRAVAAFVAMGVFVFLTLVYAAISSGPIAAEWLVPVAALMLDVGGAIALVQLFRDAAYVRDTRAWQPSWWYYVVPPVGIAVGGLFVGELLDVSMVGITASLLLFGVVAWGASAWYLYRRHQFVGVP